MKIIHNIIAIILVLVIISFTSINAQASPYNDVEEKIIVFQFIIAHMTMFM